MTPSHADGPPSEASKNVVYRATLEPIRVAKIIKLKKERATLAGIAKAVDCSPMRVLQVINAITKKRGKEVFRPDNVLLSVREAAVQLGTSAETVLALITSDQVPAQCRCGGKGFLLASAGMEALRKHKLITRKLTCTVCEKEFKIGTHQGRKTTCSDQCAREHKKVRQVKTLTEIPIQSTLRGWHKKLFDRLFSHYISLADEVWLLPSEAHNLTGLSSMQLEWLRKRSVVSMYDHPTKKWRGRPVLQYARSEMVIAKEVYEKYCNRIAQD